MKKRQEYATQSARLPNGLKNQFPRNLILQNFETVGKKKKLQIFERHTCSVKLYNKRDF